MGNPHGRAVSITDGSYELDINSDGSLNADVKDAGNDTLLQGNLTLNGSIQQLNSNTASRVVTVQANPDNAGYVYIGKSNVSSTAHMAVLAPGSSMTFTVSNVNLLYAIGTSGDKVAFGGEV